MDILRLLETGRVELEGLVPWSSNYTFLTRVCTEAEEALAVYKPDKGERPLWDFASGTLCQREQAACVVSEALGWGLVPPTIVRDGPHGRGSLQQFIEHDPNQHYFTFGGQHRRPLQQITAFDVVVNNADRKGGHVVVDDDGRLWAIDHGICFHTEYKLRTVIWDFAGELIPADLLAGLRALQQQLNDRLAPVSLALAGLLTRAEVAAMKRRLAGLVETAIFPEPGPGRHYPWPLV
ncbi:MAG: SCO1664 family protein [Chloroflexota bacterium]